MSATGFIGAAACAAWLMGLPPSLPDLYVARQPGQAICLKATGALPGEKICRGAFWVDGQGRAIVMAIDDFGVQVHEACHLLQHRNGRPRTEAECYAVQARAGECFIGLGAPGMDGPGGP